MALTGLTTENFAQRWQREREQTFPIKANVINKTSNDADIESCWNRSRSKVGGCVRVSGALQEERSLRDEGPGRGETAFKMRWHSYVSMSGVGPTWRRRKISENFNMLEISINEIIESNLMFCPQRRENSLSFTSLNSLSII